MLEKIKESIGRNHFAQMAICCALPIVLILGLSLIGISGPIVFLGALILCVGGHIVMMGRAAQNGGKACH